MRAPRPRCERCEDVIGVYEPMIVVVASGVWETSWAAEPSLTLEDGEIYHRECYLEHLTLPAS